MDKIETQVTLPKGAHPLSNYARFYASGDDGEVIATYLVPLRNELGTGETCEELTGNFEGRPVPCPTMQSSPTLSAGERRWLNNARDLPDIDEGGCAQVTVIFKKSKSAVTSAKCNGQA